MMTLNLAVTERTQWTGDLAEDGIHKQNYKEQVAAICSRLASLGRTIAFGESATAGRLAYEFSMAIGAGEVLVGSIVCYDERVKKDLLKVAPALIEAHTAESMEVTRELAVGVRRLMPADLVVAVTGLVRPGGSESIAKPVGTMFFTVLYEGNCYDHELQVEGTPEEVVDYTLLYVCHSLDRLLASNERSFSKKHL